MEAGEQAVEKIRRLSVCIVVVAAVYGLPDLAHACGGLAPAETEVETAPTIDAQRAFVRVGDEKMRTHLQMSARRAGDDFAWVLPVAAGSDLEVGDPELFEALREETSPEVEVTVQFTGSESEGCGFGSSPQGTASEGPGQSTGPVEHVEGGRIGDYTYDIIDSTDTQAATQWLEDNGYAVDETLDEQLGRYLDRGMHIAAVQLTGGADEVQTPDPLVVESAPPADGRFGYPLALSRASAPERTSLVLYVLAAGRYRLALDGQTNYREVGQWLGRQQIRTDRSPDYTAAVDAAGDGGPVWLTEYARSLDDSDCYRGANCPSAIDDQLSGSWGEGGPFLTRLFARFPRADLQDLTVRPTDHDRTVNPNHRARYTDEQLPELMPDAGRSVDASVILLALFMLVGRRRR